MNGLTIAKCNVLCGDRDRPDVGFPPRHRALLAAVSAAAPWYSSHNTSSRLFRLQHPAAINACSRAAVIPQPLAAAVLLPAMPFGQFQQSAIPRRVRYSSEQDLQTHFWRLRSGLSHVSSNFALCQISQTQLRSSETHIHQTPEVGAAKQTLSSMDHAPEQASCRCMSDFRRRAVDSAKLDDTCDAD